MQNNDKLSVVVILHSWSGIFPMEIEIKKIWKVHVQ